ncbi:MAG: hypothetical protein AAFP96_01810 [Bacteroidota bacterium]
MRAEELHVKLSQKRLSKPEVNGLTHQLLNHPELVLPLIQHVFEEEKEGAFMASWVLDHLLRRNLSLLLPHIEFFISGLPGMQSDSSIRPMAHCCEMLLIKVYKKKDPVYTKAINTTHKEILLSTNFDWLIGPYRAATKVFAMTNVYYLGKEFAWVHPELTSVLQETLSEGSRAYQNRGSKILKRLIQEAQ